MILLETFVALVVFLFQLPAIAAYCECGYTLSIPSGSASTFYTFTDLVESDFLHLKDIATDTDWKRQNYTVSRESARGPYGIQFDQGNLLSRPIIDPLSFSAHGEHGFGPGLIFRVKSGVTANGLVSSAQINSAREDMLHGTYRAVLKLPSVSGTCSAFFWYYNNSQEIDIELLSSQFFRNGTSLINLVDQSPQSATQGYSIPGKTYAVATLNFDPSDNWHEFRIDFLQDNIIYYVDNQVIGQLNGSLPDEPGHMIITQWSNGDPGWSGGPPVADAILSLASVRAYFNSSNPARQSDVSERCANPSEPGAYCTIPDYVPNPDVVFTDFFFRQDNKTKNQTIYDKKSDATTLNVSICWMTIALGIFHWWFTGNGGMENFLQAMHNRVENELREARGENHERWM